MLARSPLPFESLAPSESLRIFSYEVFSQICEFSIFGEFLWHLVMPFCSIGWLGRHLLFGCFGPWSFPRPTLFFCIPFHLLRKIPLIKNPKHKPLMKAVVIPNEFKSPTISKPMQYELENEILWRKIFKPCSYGFALKNQKLRVIKKMEFSVYGSLFFRTGVGTSVEIWRRRRWLSFCAPEVVLVSNRDHLINIPNWFQNTFKKKFKGENMYK